MEESILTMSRCPSNEEIVKSLKALKSTSAALHILSSEEDSFSDRSKESYVDSDDSGLLKENYFKNSVAPLEKNACVGRWQCDCPEINQASSVRYLGVEFDQHLKWDKHVSKLNNSIRKLVYVCREQRGMARFVRKPTKPVASVGNAFGSSSDQTTFKSDSDSDGKRVAFKDSQKSPVMEIIYKNFPPTSPENRCLSSFKRRHLDKEYGRQLSRKIKAAANNDGLRMVCQTEAASEEENSNIIDLRAGGDHLDNEQLSGKLIDNLSQVILKSRHLDEEILEGNLPSNVNVKSEEPKSNSEFTGDESQLVKFVKRRPNERKIRQKRRFREKDNFSTFLSKAENCEINNANARFMIRSLINSILKNDDDAADEKSSETELLIRVVKKCILQGKLHYVSRILDENDEENLRGEFQNPTDRREFVLFENMIRKYVRLGMKERLEDSIALIYYIMSALKNEPKKRRSNVGDGKKIQIKSMVEAFLSSNRNASFRKIIETVVRAYAIENPSATEAELARKRLIVGHSVVCKFARLFLKNDKLIDYKATLDGSECPKVPRKSTVHFGSSGRCFDISWRKTGGARTRKPPPSKKIVFPGNKSFRMNATLPERLAQLDGRRRKTLIRFAK